MKQRNMMPYRISSILLLALLAGCAANPNPIIDTKGVDKARMAEDWQECEQISKEVNVPTGVAKGAGLGAAVGAAAGAIGGDVSESAGWGALWGGTRSGLDADKEQSKVFKRCMKGRGYRVLN
ncbi:MAG: hypothetical protein QNJ19_08090 [Woeseiaceae bacterium]|nr:hypothetical protein [Woeseiaceae bacterium]